MNVVPLALGGLAGWYLWERSHRRTHSITGGLHPEITLPHEQEWELWHNEFSLCSKKMRVCLAELGIPHAAHRVDLIETGSYETISRAFLAVNPAGLVPVLVHRGHPVYESHDQIAYASEHSGDPGRLVPDDPRARAVMDRWVHKGSLVGDDPPKAARETAGNAVPGLTMPLFAAMLPDVPVHRILEGLLFHRLKMRPIGFLAMKVRGLRAVATTEPFHSMIRSSRLAMHGHLDDLEATLGETGGPWITGARFTLADVGMMAILDRIREADWESELLVDRRPCVQEYWRALKARPSYAAAIAAHEHPTVVRGTERIVALKRSDPAFAAALAS